MTDDLDNTTAIRPLTPEEEDPSKRQAVLLVMTGPTTGQTIYLETKDEWSLGRSTQCDVSFHDASVSRQHCRVFFKRPNQWVIEDLQSSNGTYVNNERIQTRALNSGDKIQLGSTMVVKFVLQDELEASFQRELYESATKDALTSLYSKRFFFDQLDVEFKYHRRIRKPLSIALVDIDFFKKINDTRGHLAGDYVLKEMGRLLLHVLRRGDLVGRYGGEEIIYMLRETPLPGAKIFAEKIRKLVEEHPFYYEKSQIRVTVSIGIASSTEENFDTPADLIKAADEFLYKAKQTGRNRVCCLID